MEPQGSQSLNMPTDCANELHTEVRRSARIRNKVQYNSMNLKPKSAKLDKKRSQKRSRQTKPERIAQGKRPRNSRSYRRKLNPTIVNALVKAAKDKDLEVFYQKAEELREWEVKMKQKKQSEREDISDNQETGTAEPRPPVNTASQLNLVIHGIGKPTINKASARQLSQPKDGRKQTLQQNRVPAKNAKKLFAATVSTFKRHQDWVLCKDQSEFQRQCITPHMCRRCFVNDHDYSKCLKPQKLYQEDLTPQCIHTFNCQHFWPANCSTTTSFAEQEAEKVRKKYTSMDISFRPVVHMLNEEADDGDVDVVGYESDDPDEPDLLCNETLPASPIKRHVPEYGTEILSLEIQVHSIHISKALGISELEVKQLQPTGGGTEAKTKSAVTNTIPCNPSDAYIEEPDVLEECWDEPFCEIVVPKYDIWYGIPLHTDVYTRLDKVDAETREKARMLISRCGNGMRDLKDTVFLNYSHVVSSLPPEIHVFFNRVRLEWLDPDRLHMTQILYNRIFDQEFTARENIMHVTPTGGIESTTFSLLLQTYMGIVVPDGSTKAVDVIADDAREQLMMVRNSKRQITCVEIIVPVVIYSGKKPLKYHIMSKEQEIFHCWSLYYSKSKCSYMLPLPPAKLPPPPPDRAYINQASPVTAVISRAVLKIPQWRVHVISSTKTNLSPR